MAIIAGQGTILQLETATGPSVYTTIAQRVTISGPNRVVGSIETTHLDSATRTFRPGLLDNGELSMTIEYDPVAATHVLLTDLMATPSLENWKLTFADSATTTYSFEGFLTSFNTTGMEPDGNLTGEISIKLNALTIAAT